MTEDNTKVTYIEYEYNTVDDFVEGDFAGPSETIIPEIFFNWEYTFGQVAEVTYDFEEHNVRVISNIIAAENVIIDEWIADMD